MGRTYHWYEGTERIWNPQQYEYAISQQITGPLDVETYITYIFDGPAGLDLNSLPNNPDYVVILAWLAAKIEPFDATFIEHSLTAPQAYGGQWFMSFDGPAGYDPTAVDVFGAQGDTRNNSGDTAPGRLEVAPRPYVSDPGWEEESWAFNQWTRVMADDGFAHAASPGVGIDPTNTYIGPPTPRYSSGYPAAWGLPDEKVILDPHQVDIGQATVLRASRAGGFPELHIQYIFDGLKVLAATARDTKPLATLVSKSLYVFPGWFPPSTGPRSVVNAQPAGGGIRRLGRVVGGAADAVVLG